MLTTPFNKFSVGLSLFIAIFFVFVLPAAPKHDILPSCLRPQPLDPVRPWGFLDISSVIEQVSESCEEKVFRGVLEGDFDQDFDRDVIIAQACTGAGIVGSGLPARLFMNENSRYVERTAELIPGLLESEVRWWANVHDLTGDSWPDIFVPGGDGQPARLFRNLGRGIDGAFLGFIEDSSRIQGPLSQECFSYHSHKADLDNDGQMDLVVFQYRPDLSFENGQTRVLMGRKGLLVDETATRLPVRSEPTIYGEVDDVDMDGTVDIIANNLLNGLVPLDNVPPETPTLRGLINDGSGNFPTNLEQIMPERNNKYSGFGVYALAIHDINDDDRMDVYVINFGFPSGSEHRDGVLLNLGSGNQLFNQVVYPTFPDDQADDDGDHPVISDLDGDHLNDVVVVQFATPPFLLRNIAGTLEELTPPEAPNESGFRVKVFDANGDNAPDVWYGMDTLNYLMIGNVAEREPNETWKQSNCISTNPAFVMATVSTIADHDFFRLPVEKLKYGATITLQPPSNADLLLRLYNKHGKEIAVSSQPGLGSIETLLIQPGSPAVYVEVTNQSAVGSGFYRLSMIP